MSCYEQRLVEWDRNYLRDKDDLQAMLDEMQAELGPSWRFGGQLLNRGVVWVREIPSPEAGVMLMEIGTRLELLASDCDYDGMALKLSRLASCVEAVAKGDVVTIEDITGKPRN